MTDPAPLVTLPTGRCACGSDNAPHRGELKTTRVAPGVVRDEYEYRCTNCLTGATQDQAQ